MQGETLTYEKEHAPDVAPFLRQRARSARIAGRHLTREDAQDLAQDSLVLLMTNPRRFKISDTLTLVKAANAYFAVALGSMRGRPSYELSTPIYPA